MEEERLNEAGAEQSIGTTGRGIGPCYQDKVGRIAAVRVGELLYPDHLRERLNIIVPRKNRLLRGLSPDAKQFDADALCREYLGYAEQMRPHVVNTTQLLHDGLRAGKRILFEAAQGSLLDVDHGTYPYVTSSNSSTAGVWSGSGVPSRNLDRVVGVIKAYSTRVGRGPFPTELTTARGIGERIRRTGREYGTVTGRPRRCGWFDAVAVRYTAAIGGADEMAVMLLDVLSEVDEVRIAVAYEMDGERIDHFPERCASCWSAASRSTRRCRVGAKDVERRAAAGRSAGRGAALHRPADGIAGIAGLHCLRGAGSGADDSFAVIGSLPP